MREGSLPSYSWYSTFQPRSSSAGDGLPRTAVIEAVVAHSDRPGFRHVHRVAAAVRPLVATAAKRLWRDDIAYAERRYAQRAARSRP